MYAFTTNPSEKQSNILKTMPHPSIYCPDIWMHVRGDIISLKNCHFHNNTKKKFYGSCISFVASIFSWIKTNISLTPFQRCHTFTCFLYWPCPTRMQATQGPSSAGDHSHRSARSRYTNARGAGGGGVVLKSRQKIRGKTTNQTRYSMLKPHVFNNELLSIWSILCFEETGT